MTPIHELLNRIRWDKEFGRDRFEIGYYDRHADTLQRVAFEEIAFPAGGQRIFEVVDESGQVRRIPFHRVREVVKGGQVIWQRSGSDASPGTEGP